jgi:hypothetical protein
MVETRETDEGRLIDQTLLLFQNAIAEAETVVPPAPFDHAVDGKDQPLSKPPEKRATSLIGDFVAFARTVSGFAASPQTEPSLQPPVAKSAWKEPAEIERFDPLVGRMLSTAMVVQIDEPNVVGAAQPPSFKLTEAAASARQPLGKSASRDALHLERPTQERRHAQIDHAYSSRVAKNATEKPVGDKRSDLRVDRALSMRTTIAIDGPNAIGAAPPPSLNTAEAAAASPRQPVDKPVSRNALPFESRTQEKPPTPIDLAHPPAVIKNATENPVGDERSAPLVDQPLSMVAFVPIDESNVAEATPSPSLNLAEDAAASIRQPVVKLDSRALPLEHPTQEEPPAAIKRAHSLVVKKVVISAQKAVLVKQLLISEAKAAHIAPPSLQPSAKQAPEKPVLDTPSDPLVDQTLSMIADDKPNTVGVVPPLPPNRPEAIGPLRKPVDESASPDILPLARQAQEDRPSLIDHALSLVKDVVISERDTVLVKKVAISEFNGVDAASPALQSSVDRPALEKPDGAPQSEASVDDAPSTIVPIGEPNVIAGASPPALSTAEAEPLSRQRPIDRSASKDMLRSLERLAQEEPPSIDRAHPAVVEGAPTALKTETAVSLPQQPFIRQLSPEDRLDEELVDIRRRVAAFKEHQQRFRREREEYYATTMARARGNPADASDRGSG